jgi:hypothetical protein
MGEMKWTNNEEIEKASVELAVRFNEAVTEQFRGDPRGVSGLVLIIASISLLSKYVSRVSDRKWKRRMLDSIWDQLMEEWDLIG